MKQFPVNSVIRASWKGLLSNTGTGVLENHRPQCRAIIDPPAKRWQAV